MDPDLGRRFRLASGYALLVPAETHLRVEEHGDPGSAEEMTRYFDAIARALATHRLTTMLIIAQRQAPDATSPKWIPIRNARWKALANSRARRIAVVVDDDLAMTRVKMTALAEKAPVRPFMKEADAIAWLTAAG